jgi:hypothetical protein
MGASNSADGLVGASRRALALAAIVALSAVALRAEEFVSEQYGFRFEVPTGFEEWPDSTPITVKAFAEVEPDDGHSISIQLQHLGQEVNPSHRMDQAELPQSENLRLSLETRRWLKTELQVIRQDGRIPPGVEVVGYLIQFPLRDDAIQIRVQGPKSREGEISKVFDQSIQSFVNLKPYIVSVERVEPGIATRAVTRLLSLLVIPCILVLMLAFFVVRIRKSQARLP